jgi:hypothetical protein
MPDTPTLLTFRQFSERFPAISESSLRWIRFNQEKNGFAPAFLRLGRRVLVDQDRFLEILFGHNRR